MKTQQIQNNGISFGIHNNKSIARRVLANVDPETRTKIYQEIDYFCKLSQRHGVKGELRIKSLNSFSIKLANTNTVIDRDQSSLYRGSFIGSIPRELWTRNVK